MDNQELFFRLVERHCTVNLQKCRRFIDVQHEGIAVLSEEHMPYGQGVDECEHYPGIFIVKNGPETLQDLVRKKWILDEVIGGFQAAARGEEFLGILARDDDVKNEGRAYLFDGVNQSVTQVYKFANEPSPVARRFRFDVLGMHFDVGVGRSNPYYSERLRLEELLPRDFLSTDSSVALHPAVIGTKTDLGMRFPRAYPELHTLQIKRASYGDFGMGKVTHFDKEGLVEEMYIAIGEQVRGPFIDAAYNLVGVHRVYRDEEGRPFRNAEERLTPYHVGLIDPALGYRAESYVLPFLSKVA